MGRHYECNIQVSSLSMQFEPTINNKGNGLDFRSESEVYQNLNSIDSFGNNISQRTQSRRTPNKGEGESTGCVGTKCWTRFCVRTFERQLFL